MRSDNFNTGSVRQTGILPSATPVVVPFQSIYIPATVFLTSSDAGRLIEYSVDGGTTYFNATYDASSAAQLVVKIGSKITHLRFTGAAAGTDTYGIL